MASYSWCCVSRLFTTLKSKNIPATLITADLLLAALAPTVLGATPLPGKDAAASAAAREVELLAARIDQQLLTRLAEAKIQPAPLADDGEFVRRAYIDVIGRIPTIHEVRTFLKNNSVDKRRKLIDRLLGSSGYVNHFTNEWRALYLAEACSCRSLGRFAPGPLGFGFLEESSELFTRWSISGYV